jgi:putative transposase
MKISLRLDRGQRRRMTRLLRKTRSRIEALRARVLLLLDEGVVPGVVAEMAGCARATVYRTLYRFEDLGEDALVDQRHLRPPIKVTAEIEERLVGYIDGSPQDFGWQRTTWTLELLSVQLTLDAGVRLSASHVRNVLLANQVRRGRPRVGLRIPVRGRRRILNEIDRLVESANAEDEVFYVDEADIDLNPRIGPTYMRRGKQLVVLTPGKNVKRYVAGALNARSGKVVHAVAERKNSELFLALVDALRRTYRRARRIHLVLDNFIIHKSRRTLRHLAGLGGRIVLHFLPPYSPESNVIERLWKQLHDHVTRNHTHRTIEPLMEAVDEFIEGAQPFPGTQVSMLAHAA